MNRVPIDGSNCRADKPIALSRSCSSGFVRSITSVSRGACSFLVSHHLTCIRFQSLKYNDLALLTQLDLIDEIRGPVHPWRHWRTPCQFSSWSTEPCRRDPYGCFRPDSCQWARYCVECPRKRPVRSSVHWPGCCCPWDCTRVPVVDRKAWAWQTVCWGSLGNRKFYANSELTYEPFAKRTT